MQLLLRFFRNRTIGFKLLLYFFILILLPVVTLGVIGKLIYSRSIEEQANSYTEQMLEQVSRNVEFYIHDMWIVFY